MSEFIVYVREVWIQAVKIEAATKTDAIEMVANGEGETLDGELEYSHTLDTDTWEAEQED